MVATKAALSIRVDALSDAESRSDPQAAEVGITNRVKLESRLRALEHQNGIQSTRRATTGANGRQQPKFDLSAGSGSGAYNANADSVNVGSVAGMLPTQPEGAVKAAVAAVTEVKEEKRAEKADGDKKDKKKKRKSEAATEAGDVTMDGDEREGETKEERRARKEAKKAVSYECACVRAGADVQAKLAAKGEDGEKKSKKRRASEVNGGEEVAVEDGEKKKKKKKRESVA
jgi:nucleolar protein 58